MNTTFYPPASRTRCTVIKTGEDVVFLGYQAGGTEKECEQGVVLCKRKDGTTRRFHSRELKRRNNNDI